MVKLIASLKGYKGVSLTPLGTANPIPAPTIQPILITTGAKERDREDPRGAAAFRSGGCGTTASIYSLNATLLATHVYADVRAFQRTVKPLPR